MAKSMSRNQITKTRRVNHDLSIDEFRKLINHKVIKLTGKPFKSTFQTNTSNYIPISIWI